MDCLSNPSHSPLLHGTTTALLAKHIHSAFMDFLRFSTLLLVLFIESFFLLQRWEPIFHTLVLLSCSLLFFILKHSSHLSRPPPTYLVDFSCLKPPNFCRVPLSRFLEHAQMIDFFDKESTTFMAKVLTSSGQGEQTYLPPAIHHIPPRSDHHEAIKEVHMVLFPVFEDLLSKTKLSPQDIDILIVNCSGFCPAPSLSSIVVNEYSMRDDVKTFNLTGMGCSASALAIDTAQNLLKVHKNSNAVVLNCLFRMGSAAILLSNKNEAKKSSKYKLLRTSRSQRAFDDKAYYSAYREEDSNGITGVTLRRDLLQEDSNGITGVTLRRDLLQVAGETLWPHVTALGSSILPLMEIFRYAVSVIWKRFIDKSVEICLPNFASMQHFCLPASGRAVIGEIGKGLRLGEREMEPALMTLHRFGNQSSSSLWYELAYLEGKERVKKGDRVWQLGIGSGPKWAHCWGGPERPMGW